MVVMAKFPIPEQVVPPAQVPVLSDSDLATEIVSRLSAYLPDADCHRLAAKKVVEDVLGGWRNFGPSAGVAHGTRQE